MEMLALGLRLILFGTGVVVMGCSSIIMVSLLFVASMGISGIDTIKVLMPLFFVGMLLSQLALAFWPYSAKSEDAALESST